MFRDISDYDRTIDPYRGEITDLLYRVCVESEY